MFDNEQISTVTLLKIMILAPSTIVVFPYKLFAVVEEIFLWASPMKIEGHKFDAWEVPYVSSPSCEEVQIFLG